MRARDITPVGLSFLDAMTCGLGAVILLFMIINAAVRDHTITVTSDLRAEVDRLESEVLEGHRNLVELRNAVTETDDERALTQGLAQRLIEMLKEIHVELATFEDSTLAQREHINELQADLRSLEEDARRLLADEARRGNAELVEEHRVGAVVDHRVDRANLQTSATAGFA